MRFRIAAMLLTATALLAACSGDDTPAPVSPSTTSNTPVSNPNGSTTTLVAANDPVLQAALQDVVTKLTAPGEMGAADRAKLVSDPSDLEPLIVQALASPLAVGAVVQVQAARELSVEQCQERVAAKQCAGGVYVIKMSDKIAAGPTQMWFVKSSSGWTVERATYCGLLRLTRVLCPEDTAPLGETPANSASAETTTS